MRQLRNKSKERTGPVENMTLHHSDSALGMNARICRRDFLNSTPPASGSVLLKSLTPLQFLAEQRFAVGTRS